MTSEIPQFENSKSSDKKRHEYDIRYARQYLERTMHAPYTLFKNKEIASLVKSLGFQEVVDIGSNVSGILRMPGSLRYQLDELGIDGYVALDLSESYFDTETAKQLGVAVEDTYSSVEHHVSSVEELPFNDESIELVVCADVIEHVNNTRQAFYEMSRVLKPNGKIIMIIPSLYKSDLFNFKHIQDQRYSSHERKLTLSGWSKEWSSNTDLEVDRENSRPLGIVSGLSYLCWMDNAFVPHRENANEPEKYSDNASLHYKAKTLFAKHDDIIDHFILESHPEVYVTILDMLRSGKVSDVFTLIKDLYAEMITNQKVSLLDGDREIIREFFGTIGNIDFEHKPEIEAVRGVFSQEEAKYLIGNSAMLVLQHSNK